MALRTTVDCVLHDPEPTKQDNLHPVSRPDAAEPESGVRAGRMVRWSQTGWPPDIDLRGTGQGLKANGRRNLLKLARFFKLQASPLIAGKIPGAQGLEVDLVRPVKGDEMAQNGGLRPSPYSVFLHKSCRYPLFMGAVS